jgi:hypothetical protein
VTPAVRFEIEADAEYRLAGRWYDEQRAGLGAEFFDAVDATLDRIVRMPHAGARVPRVRADLPVRRAPGRSWLSAPVHGRPVRVCARPLRLELLAVHLA